MLFGGIMHSFHWQEKEEHRAAGIGEKWFPNRHFTELQTVPVKVHTMIQWLVEQPLAALTWS